MPTTLLLSLKVPDASRTTFASYPACVAEIAGKDAQTSSEIPAIKICLRPVASTAFATFGSSHALMSLTPESNPICSSTKSKTVFSFWRIGEAEVFLAWALIFVIPNIKLKLKKMFSLCYLCVILYRKVRDIIFIFLRCYTIG